MTTTPHDPHVEPLDVATPGPAGSASTLSGDPTLAEDLLLLLFQPDSGTIAGETTLYYPLGGAIVTELVMNDSITAEAAENGAAMLSARADRAPADPVLRAAWDYVSPRPRGVQGVLAAIGPSLRGPLLDRLVDRGDLVREKRKALGLFPTTSLREGSTGRRERLFADVRAVLVDQAAPSPRSAALAALLSGSGTLPQFDPEIPWRGPVIARAKELEQGDWGAGAAAEAVTRTMTAIVINSVTVANAVAASRR